MFEEKQSDFQRMPLNLFLLQKMYSTLFLGKYLSEVMFKGFEELFKFNLFWIFEKEKS